MLTFEINRRFVEIDHKKAALYKLTAKRRGKACVRRIEGNVIIIALVVFLWLVFGFRRRAAG